MVVLTLAVSGRALVERRRRTVVARWPPVKATSGPTTTTDNQLRLRPAGQPAADRDAPAPMQMPPVVHEHDPAHAAVVGVDQNTATGHRDPHTGVIQLRHRRSQAGRAGDLRR
jgi:hypothetical protein